MDCSKDHSVHGTCCTSVSNHSVSQTLSEMEFERGIWYAAQYNDSDRVESLLRKGISPDAEDSAGYKALHYAARNGHRGICELLLRSGANVNARTRSGQVTALHRAATQGHIDVAELLLRFGADANLKDADGFTALHRALKATSISLCKLLIPCTDLTVADAFGITIEQFAREHCSEILPFLIDRAGR